MITEQTNNDNTAQDAVTSNRTISLEYSETLYSAVKRHANEKGITLEKAFLQLTTDALKLTDLMRGVVTEISPDVKGQLKDITLSALKQHQETLIPVSNDNEAPTEEAAAVVNDNQIIFSATPELKDLISQINETRAQNGLAPVEQSLAELLLHWSENLGDNSVFKPTTGMEYDWFKKNIIALGEQERKSNGAQSNLISKEGDFLGKYYRVVKTLSNNA